MFLGAIFFGPLFVSIPPAATTPILIFCGMQLFMNVQRTKANIRQVRLAAPVAIVFFIVHTVYVPCSRRRLEDAYPTILHAFE